jgi:hypothetical protein
LAWFYFFPDKKIRATAARAAMVRKLLLPMSAIPGMLEEVGPVAGGVVGGVVGPGVVGFVAISPGWARGGTD